MRKYKYPESIQSTYARVLHYRSAYQCIDVAVPIAWSKGVQNAICLRDDTALFLRSSRNDLDTVDCTLSDLCMTSLALNGDDSHCDVLYIVRHLMFCVTFHLRRNDIPH